MWTRISVTVSTIPRRHIQVPKVQVPSRTFISLPTFHANPLTGPTPRKHNEEHILNFSQEEFYNVVVDVAQYRHFVPWCTDSVVHGVPRETKVVCSVPEAKGAPISQCISHADLGIGFKAFKETYTSQVISEPPWKVQAIAHDASIFRRLITSWEFVPYSCLPSATLARFNRRRINNAQISADQKCLIRFGIDFELNSILYSQVADLFFNQVCKEMLHAFTSRCKQVYGRR
ncbi:Coenzyme Q-binding protein coq10a, mitochondrial [Dispira simplex]|nr:Coenzyme Q-binding protein coq10a, mitochondrial [Dispira simplex]